MVERILLPSSFQWAFWDMPVMHIQPVTGSFACHAGLAAGI